MFWGTKTEKEKNKKERNEKTIQNRRIPPKNRWIEDRQNRWMTDLRLH